MKLTESPKFWKAFTIAMVLIAFSLLSFSIAGAIGWIDTDTYNSMPSEQTETSSIPTADFVTVFTDQPGGEVVEITGMDPTACVRMAAKYNSTEADPSVVHTCVGDTDNVPPSAYDYIPPQARSAEVQQAIEAGMEEYRRNRDGVSLIVIIKNTGESYTLDGNMTVADCQKAIPLQAAAWGSGVQFLCE